MRVLRDYMRMRHHNVRNARNTKYKLCFIWC